MMRRIGVFGSGLGLRYRETVREGLDNTLDTFFAMMRGESVGKMIVKL